MFGTSNVCKTAAAFFPIVIFCAIACCSVSHAMDNPEEWAELRARQQASADGRVKPNGLIKAISQRREMIAGRTLPHAAGISSDRWTYLGPGNIGGRIRTIAVSPSNGNVMWLGSVGGGIWKTINGGASWSPVDDFMGNLSISSIVIDPLNQNVMYAGTGEGFFNQDALRGYGVFKSTDGGATWNFLTSTTPDSNISHSGYNCL